MQPLRVYPNVHTDDFVVAGTGLGVDLACKKSCSISRDVPAILQEESLQVVHLFAHSLAGAQGLLGRRGHKDTESLQEAVWFHFKVSKQNMGVLCIRVGSYWSSGMLCFSPWILAQLISGFPH